MTDHHFMRGTHADTCRILNIASREPVAAKLAKRVAPQATTPGAGETTGPRASSSRARPGEPAMDAQALKRLRDNMIAAWRSREVERRRIYAVRDGLRSRVAVPTSRTVWGRIVNAIGKVMK